MIEIWVPILKIGTEYVPDLPGEDMTHEERVTLAAQQAKADGRAGDKEHIREKVRTIQVEYDTDEGLPDDDVKGDGSKAVSLFNVLVDEADIPRIRAHLKAKGTDIIYFNDGPVKDVLMVRMIRACRDDYDGKAEAFFNEQIASSTLTQREKVDLLEQAGTRGLSASKRQAIAERLQLTEIEITPRGIPAR